MRVLMQWISYRSASGLRKKAEKELQMLDRLELACLAVIFLFVEVALVSGVCPLH